MVYLDFAKAFDKVDHGILLHKLKDLGITGKLGVWFFHFLSNRPHFVRLPGGVSNDHPVISGVPQGTVLGPLLFLITISDINKDISSSKLISFADDTRIYSKIAEVSDCDNLQYDLNMIYDWAITSNNMFFNAQKFHYVSFNTDPTGNKCNVYDNMSTQRWISFPIPQMFRIWGLQCQVIARLMFILTALVNVVKTSRVGS